MCIIFCVKTAFFQASPRTRAALKAKTQKNFFDQKPALRVNGKNLMPQDAITLKKLSRELNYLLGGARINKITQPSSDEVILFVYTDSGNAKLSISASALFSRVGFTSADRKNPAVAPGFCMLMRKHLLNATVKSVELLGDERIIKIAFNSKNDFLEPTEKQLYCEIMGKYSNVILCENGVIAGTMKPSQIDFSKDRT